MAVRSPDAVPAADLDAAVAGIHDVQRRLVLDVTPTEYRDRRLDALRAILGALHGVNPTNPVSPSSERMPRRYTEDGRTRPRVVTGRYQRPRRPAPCAGADADP